MRKREATHKHGFHANRAVDARHMERVYLGKDVAVTSQHDVKGRAAVNDKRPSRESLTAILESRNLPYGVRIDRYDGGFVALEVPQGRLNFDDPESTYLDKWGDIRSYFPCLDGWIFDPYFRRWVTTPQNAELTIPILLADLASTTIL